MAMNRTLRTTLCAVLVAVGRFDSADATEQASDLDALTLADQATPEAAKASDWHVFSETSLAHVNPRNGNVGGQRDRLSLDLGYDARFSPNWRGVLSDRLDWGRLNDTSSSRQGVNTLREIYLSYQPSPEWVFDVGRVNTRYGLGFGYNPTDFLRANTLRSVVSTDPTSLRQNRLGTFMLRSQALWTGGGITALFAPKLSTERSDATFGLDVGATNARDQWLLSASHEFGPSFSPQFLLYQQRGGKTQVGLNATASVGNATVLYAEWSGGQGTSQLAKVPNQPFSESALHWQNRYAVGVRYSTAYKATWTLELEGNGAAPSAAQWDALQHGSTQIYAAYRKTVSAQQDLPTRRSLFAHILWAGVGLDRLDLSGYWRRDLVDRSYTLWSEARYHLDSSDVVLRWQRNIGSPFTNFGGSPQRSMVQLMFVYYFR